MGWSTQALIILLGRQQVPRLQAPLGHYRVDIADFTEVLWALLIAVNIYDFT